MPPWAERIAIDVVIAVVGGIITFVVCEKVRLCFSRKEQSKKILADMRNLPLPAKRILAKLSKAIFHSAWYANGVDGITQLVDKGWLVIEGMPDEYPEVKSMGKVYCLRDDIAKLAKKFAKKHPELLPPEPLPDEITHLNLRELRDSTPSAEWEKYKTIARAIRNSKANRDAKSALETPQTEEGKPS